MIFNINSTRGHTGSLLVTTEGRFNYRRRGRLGKDMGHLDPV